MIQAARPRMILNSGLSMSVQASEHHYSSPRETGRHIWYEAVEIGFPSEFEPLLEPFKEDYGITDAEIEPFTGSVFPYVPSVVLQEILDRHGGISPDSPSPSKCLPLLNQSVEDYHHWKKELFDKHPIIPVITGDRDTDALLEDERIAQEEDINDKTK